MEKLRVGNPLDKSIDIGVIVPNQLKKINSLVNKALKDGNELWQPSWHAQLMDYFILHHYLQM